MNNTLSNFIESELPYRKHTGIDKENLRERLKNEFLRRFDKFFDENPYAPLTSCTSLINQIFCSRINFQLTDL